MDRRDEQTWVAVELTIHGERLMEEGSLEGVLRRDLGVASDYPIFIPAITYKKNGMNVTLHLLESYVFLSSGLDEILYFALERKPYVERVMSTTGGPYQMRVLSVLPNREIENLRSQLHKQLSLDVVEGSWVTVARGKFKGLTGQVISVEDKDVYVRFQLRSLDRVAHLPRAYLEVGEAPSEDCGKVERSSDFSRCLI